MELKNLSAMIEWWSGLDGPNGLISAPMSYSLIILPSYVAESSLCLLSNP